MTNLELVKNLLLIQHLHKSEGVQGLSTYNSTYNDNVFYFESLENKDLFEKSPLRYIPQYGGFCSWGVTGEYCPNYPW